VKRQNQGAIGSARFGCAWSVAPFGASPEEKSRPYKFAETVLFYTDRTVDEMLRKKVKGGNHGVQNSENGTERWK
jgi:hypothetical protein